MAIGLMAQLPMPTILVQADHMEHNTPSMFLVTAFFTACAVCISLWVYKMQLARPCALGTNASPPFAPAGSEGVRRTKYKFPNSVRRAFITSGDDFNAFVDAIATTFYEQPGTAELQHVKAALESMRREVKQDPDDEGLHEPLDDIWFARTLVASDMNVATAKCLTADYVAWRRRVGGIVPPCREWLRHGALLFPFEDNLGRPVVVFRARYFKPNDLTIATIENGIRSTMDALIAHQMHRRGGTISESNPLEYCTLVFEVQDVSWSSVSKAAFKTLIHEAKTHYPDKLQFCLVLGCSATVRAMWRMLSPLFKPRTRRMVELVTSADAPAMMQGLVAREKLPLEYGGTASNWPGPQEATCLKDYLGILGEEAWRHLGVDLEERPTSPSVVTNLLEDSRSDSRIRRSRERWWGRWFLCFNE